MKILFSPSEAKYKGGSSKTFNKECFIFPELFDERKKIIDEYSKYIDNADNDELSKLFGTKKQQIIDYYKTNIYKKETMKVIERYDGVAFDYLKYPQMKDVEKEYIDKNILIFSNLFGPLLAGDSSLPDYKLKQGEKFGNLVIEKFYNEKFSSALDEYLKDEDVIDLRAGFYEKFYKIKKPYMTMKFIKDGKVVSHWAKAYRGIVLGLLAKNNIQTFDELLNIKIEKLTIQEIQKIKLKTEIIYSID